MFIIYLLSFLLSWLCGMFVILISSFITYEELSIVDITSFAILSFAGNLVLVPLVYRLTLKFFLKKVSGRNQFIYIPIVLAVISNLPVYFMLWHITGDLCGLSEAILFALCFITTAIVYGLCEAWKNKLLNKSFLQTGKKMPDKEEM